MRSGVCVEEVRMLLDPGDNSYMPSVVSVKAGTHALRLLYTVDIQQDDHWVKLLARQDEVSSNNSLF